MNIVATFTVRSVYGVSRIYPFNSVARHFANLLGVKTFNAYQIEGIRALGFTCEQVAAADVRLNMARVAEIHTDSAAVSRLFAVQA